jgi:hypothetical protein
MTFRKSTHSEAGNCAEVDDFNFRKSTHSNGNAECIEVAPGVKVRDTNDRGGVTLAFSGDAWSTFTGNIQAT